MKLIEEFYCIQTEIYGNGSEETIPEKICKIKTELLRPIISILQENKKVILRYDYIKSISENIFSKEELLFFQKYYNVKLSVNKHYPSKLTSDNSSINKLYDLPANIIFFEDTESGNNYLVIEFRRWQYDFQPRGAGEDSLGEDITYIHGIWENPFLTDEIISKIKQRN